MAFSLRFAGGNRKGEILPLPQGRPVTLGRENGNTCRVDDSKLSRVHCRFVANDGECAVCDLHSTNGTFVNGTRIEQQSLRPGDTVRIGLTALELIQTADPVPAAAQPQIAEDAAEECQALVTGLKKCSACDTQLTDEELRTARKVANRYYCRKCQSGLSAKPAPPKSLESDKDARKGGITAFLVKRYIDSPTDEVAS